ncbi:hypothetical protein QTI17_15985 [Variovorax sp. J31P179]|uniref:hypothetical protein n=1 Tax=Variovorax sp. J31P179 TaxID=3053508 RepID=UPI00257753FA|nr:hypothetical protein [Variovorax sp. J31P179]MDM0082095.1 hypothetical protein [Variovorax sp. J31P179]
MNLKIPTMWLCLLATAGTAAADALPYTGVYESWGRVCRGAARLTATTIEWKSPFSNCKRSSYEVIDIASNNEPPRIAVRIKKRSKGCDFEVIQLEEQQIGDAPKMWGINGYPSLEAYQKRELPEWKYAVSDDRMRLHCPLDPRDAPRH